MDSGLFADRDRPAMSPIRKEHRDRYPEDWAEIALFVKEANLWICQGCGRQCLRPGEQVNIPTRAERARYTLTIAHADSIYHAPAVLLLALCAPCHIRYDLAYHLAARHRNQRQRRRSYGQMVLIPQREGPLSAYELVELEAAWPGLDYLEGFGFSPQSERDSQVVSSGEKPKLEQSQ